MILVTGGTGFIGQVLLRHLVAEGRAVRTLLRPGRANPNLPAGVPVEVALSSIRDERSLRPALVGVHTVFHLAGNEWLGTRGDLNRVEIEGTRTLVAAAREAGVERILYVSHLGADRASAYPVLKAKGIAEEFIRRSGLGYTILRSGLVFGPQDHFTTALARLLHLTPLIFPLPAHGQARLQPLWVEDLVTCLVWSLDRPETLNHTLEIGGPEFLTLRECVGQVAAALGLQPRFISFSPLALRYTAILLEYLFPRAPISVYWSDYLAANRTAAIDSVSRQFGLLPARLSARLDYLHGQPWRRRAIRELLALPEREP